MSIYEDQLSKSKLGAECETFIALTFVRYGITLNTRLIPLEGMQDQLHFWRTGENFKKAFWAWRELGTYPKGGAKWSLGETEWARKMQLAPPHIPLITDANLIREQWSLLEREVAVAGGKFSMAQGWLNSNLSQSTITEADLTLSFEDYAKAFNQAKRDPTFKPPEPHFIKRVTVEDIRKMGVPNPLALPGAFALAGGSVKVIDWEAYNAKDYPDWQKDFIKYSPQLRLQALCVISIALFWFNDMQKKRNEMIALKVAGQAVDTASGLAGESEVSVKEESNLFRLSGEFWEVRFQGGEKFMLEDRKTIQTLAYLLKNPNRDVNPLELMNLGKSSGQAVRGAEFDEESLQPFLKPQKVVNDDLMPEHRKKVSELRDKIEDAIKLCNTEQERTLKDQLLEYCNQNGVTSTPNGELRSRTFADESQRPKEAARKNIDRALENIKQRDTALHQHLKSAISTNGPFSYKPSPPIGWNFS